MTQNKPFTSTNLMIGGPKHGSTFDSYGSDKIIYPVVKPLTVEPVDLNSEAFIDTEEYVYNAEGALFCGPENKRYRIFMYQGIRKNRSTI